MSAVNKLYKLGVVSIVASEGEPAAQYEFNDSYGNDAGGWRIDLPNNVGPYQSGCLFVYHVEATYRLPDSQEDEKTAYRIQSIRELAVAQLVEVESLVSQIHSES